MIIYDPQFHKVEEIYTHEEVSLDSINKMIANPKETRCIRARKRTLKFISQHVRDKYSEGGDWEEN